MRMSAPLSVRSLHLKEVGFSISTTTADHFGSCTSTSPNAHIFFKLLRRKITEYEREKEKSK